MRRIRDHLTYANVMATLAVFLVLGGGSAVALSGSNTVQSDDLGPGAQVKVPDVAANAVGSSDVINESLTGQDIKNQSGVDTCTHGTARFGEFCVGVANEGHTWEEALLLCQNLNLRLPSYGEALALGKNYDLPSIDADDVFWAEERTSSNDAFGSTDSGARVIGLASVDSDDTVCVTTPTN
jgi:hypothetical protein